MHQIPRTDNDREYPNEYTEVERPLLVQLEAMGWQCVRGELDYPQKTFRERFREVILMDKLRDAVRRINRDDDGNPYLDDVTIDRAIRELLTTTEFGVFDKNRELTDKLIRGVSVDPADRRGESGQRSVPVKFIEFDPEHLDRNEFLAINQFRVDFIGRTGFVIPDIVLLVNGIPLAVIECNSPSITEPMQAGIDQLLHYSNNRPEVEEIEVVDQLFLFNQLTPERSPKFGFRAMCTARFDTDVLAFPVVSNYFRVIRRNRPGVVSGWSDTEVARPRWMLCAARVVSAIRDVDWPTIRGLAMIRGMGEAGSRSDDG